jgi:hypothetical protein
MTTTHNPDHVLTLWHGIKRAAELPAPRPDRIASDRLKCIVHNGGAQTALVADFLIGIGAPFDLSDSWRRIAPLAKLEPYTMHWRPKARERDAWGFEGLTLVDLAYLTIMLERWAIPIDPAPLVAAVLPTLKGRGLLTDAELAVLWHKRERGRMDLIRIDAPIPDSETGAVETHGGYRAAATGDGLVIASPKIGKRAWAAELRYSGLLRRDAA